MRKKSEEGGKGRRKSEVVEGRGKEGEVKTGKRRKKRDV